ncbi:hypothetical protein [Aldersonia kunmingensis]|uniref:hypothetical protein n=1 Tax=Aldersonia kunmingensis TaxID=408066 RepID=UPI00082C89D0|nr:hypothetical protein [Aldersonia kunmingensis]
MTTNFADQYGALLASSAPAAPVAQTWQELVDPAGLADAPPVGDFKAYMTSYVEGGGQLSMDPEGMKGIIADCDKHIDELVQLQQRAYEDLYPETLGIGEDGFPPAKQLLTKYQHKARGGGSLPHHSSAVGYFDGLIAWVTDFRDGLQTALDAYVGTDGGTESRFNSIGLE